MSDEDVVLVDPWVDLRGRGTGDDEERHRLADELRAEVAPGHPLFGVEVVTIGRSRARDDVLFRLADGRWAIVHLSWQHPDRPPWPLTRVYYLASEAEAVTASG